MRRMISLLLSAALLLALLPGCRTEVGVSTPTRPVDSSPAPSASEPEPDLTAAGLAGLALLSSGCEDPDNVEYLNADGDLLAVYLENAYGLQLPWEDAAIIRATGASAFEIAVLRMEDSDAAVQASTALMSYIFARQGDFTGYAPAQADMVASGGIMQDGPFAALFICPDPDGARAAVEAALGGTTPPAPGESAEPDPSPESSANPGPTFELHDLMLRLLVEAACPEWSSTSPKSWSDTRGTGRDWMCREIANKYGVTTSQYENAAIAYWGTPHSDGFGALFSACDYELAVFRTADEAAAADLADALNGYLTEKAAQLRQEGREDMAQLLADGRAAQSERYAVLIVSDHTADAILLFPRAVHSNDTSGYFRSFHQGQQPASPDTPDDTHPDRYKFTQPNKDDMSIYDTSAILAAWGSGDPSGLSQYDRDIYDSAKRVLDDVLKSGMSDYEKEVAIYHWVVHNVDYDWTHQNILLHTPRESFTPYGGLVNHTAVCLGYATTFQLLMDLAGVECITVVGAAFQSQEDHAWNMVRLNGQWYCVDVTWDANYREQVQSNWPLEYWNHFNVTSDEMAAENHQWDYANTPEATATDRGQS